MLRLREAICGHDTPPTIRTYPELRMHFVFWNDLASQNVAHEQVIVHRLRDDLCDGRRCKLDEPVVFRPACLHTSLFNDQTGDLVTQADTPSYSARGGDAISLRIERNMRATDPRRSHVEFGRDKLRPLLTPAERRPYERLVAARE